MNSLGIFRLIFLGILFASLFSCPSYARDNSKPLPPDITFLYHSCKRGLKDDTFKKSYCYALLSGFFESFYELNAAIVSYHLDAPTCDIRKQMVYWDITNRFDPDFLKMGPKGAAKNFIKWIDQNGAPMDFPLPIKSPAERAFASSLIGSSGVHFKPYTPNWQNESKLTPEQSAGVDDWFKSLEGRDSKKLCQEAFGKPDFEKSRCHAVITGSLIAFGISKYKIPEYKHTDDCANEKNAEVSVYRQHNLGCFPADENYQKNIAFDLATMTSPYTGTQNTRIVFRYGCP